MHGFFEASCFGSFKCFKWLTVCKENDDGESMGYSRNHVSGVYKTHVDDTAFIQRLQLFKFSLLDALFLRC